MRKKVLLIGGDMSFVRNDYVILKRKYDVNFFKFNSYGDLLLRLYILPKWIIQSDLVYIWFGSILSALVVLLAKIFRKKTVVIAGGFDVANERSIGYGAMGHPFKKHFQKFTFNNADVVFPVSKCSKNELIRYSNPKHHHIVYNGINQSKFKPGKERKKDIVITVVATLDKRTMRKKGIETFVKSARLLTDVEFKIVGDIEKEVLDHLSSFSPSNLSFEGYKDFSHLLKYYQESKVYAQLSKHESFGCALAESMLCGCVPVVTPNAALPEVVGETGFYARYGDVKDTVKAIRGALNSNKGKDARKRIISLYTLKKRENKILKILDTILS